MRVPETVQSTDDVTLKLYDLGGSGPPLLLCHATGFCGQVWQPLADTLGQWFQCIAFDFRAHGRSTAPANRALIWDGMADDILAITDAISPSEPIPAVGHSMGGATLVLAAAREPDALAAIWAFEPILFARGPVGESIPEPSEISQGARNRRAVFADRDEVFARYGSKPPLSALDDRALRAYVDHGFDDLPDGSITLRCLPENEASIFDHHNSGALGCLGEVKVPLAIAASGDGREPAIAVVGAAEANDNAELLRYEELTHFGPLEDPDGMADDIGEWMAVNGFGNAAR